MYREEDALSEFFLKFDRAAQACCHCRGGRWLLRQLLLQYLINFDRFCAWRFGGFAIGFFGVAHVILELFLDLLCHLILLALSCLGGLVGGGNLSVALLLLALLLTASSR